MIGIIQKERAMKKSILAYCMFNPKKGGVSSLDKIRCSFASWERKFKKRGALQSLRRG